MSSDHRTLLKSSKRSWLQEVYLTDEVSYLSCWQATFPDPQLRLEYEGFPVPVSTAWRGDDVKVPALLDGCCLLLSAERRLSVAPGPHALSSFSFVTRF